VLIWRLKVDNTKEHEAMHEAIKETMLDAEKTISLIKQIKIRPYNPYLAKYEEALFRIQHLLVCAYNWEPKEALDWAHIRAQGVLVYAENIYGRLAAGVKPEELY